MQDADPTVPIVGVGASAGGVEALRELIEGIDAGIGACVVIIQHLAPGHVSILHEILDRHARIPVTQIEDGATVRPDTVLVIPPGKSARMEGNHIELADRAASEPVFRPIDMFFASLARARERAACCVILSGTGSDGTEGLRAVKDAGGVAIVQEREGARFPGMPDSAIATGLVDLVLPSREIGPRLRTILRGRRRGKEAEGALAAEIEGALPEIANLLVDATGHDFADYKPGTLVRRIERRMSLLRLGGVDELIARLGDDPEQATILANDFLIGVTRFFRDPEVFDLLAREAVVPILARDAPNVRAWVPACSTGEEAYSIAILFLEAMRGAGDRRPLQVFGTDIDHHALLAARFGEFGARALEDVDPQRRDAFFQRAGEAWRARPELREACVFAPHNLLQDPPFSRLDLISCRNMLIYLKPELQAGVFPRFHFSLRREGMLLLGPAETLAGNERLFRPVDKNARLFRRDDAASAGYSALTERAPAAGRTTSLRTLREPAGPIAELSREATAQRAFLKAHAAPFAVVSEAGEVLYVSPRMMQFVGPASGVPRADIDGYLAPPLRVPVRIALEEAVRVQAAAHAESVVVADPGGPRVFDIAAEPVPDDPGAYLVTLTEVRAVDAELLDAAAQGRDASNRSHMEAENVRLRRQVAAVLREHETSGQELKSSNEELMSMNEELQSSNEELETSREELQSINEELETVNAELRENNQQLARANSDLKNLFEATDVAVLFLDRSFAVRSFTPSATAIFSIRQRDVGRPIFDLASQVEYPGLRADAASVDATLQPVERELTLPATGETFLLRMRPYRTVDDRIDGYALSFVDITTRKAAEETLRRNEETLARQYAELENLYDTTPVGLALIDRDLRFLRINETAARIDGVPLADYEGRTIPEVVPHLAPLVAPLYAHVFETGAPVLGREISTTMAETGDLLRHFIADFYPVRIGEEVYAAGVCVREVTDQKRLMEEVAASEARMSRIFDAAPLFVAITEGPRHAYLYSNPAQDRVVGRRPSRGQPIAEAFPELEEQGVVALYDRVFREGATIQRPEVAVAWPARETEGPPTHWISHALEPVRDAAGAITGVISYAFDVTDQVQARLGMEVQYDRQRLLLGELQHRVKNTLATIRAISRMLVSGSGDARSFHDRLSARLGALSRTHDLLTDAEWAELGLERIVAMEAQPYNADGEDRVIYEGDGIALSSREATSVGMAVHELMTNAAKHGALSAPSGRVRIEARAARGRAHLIWTEEGGPPAAEPDADASGFGAFVLNRVLASDLSADVEAEWRPEGLRYRIAFELETTL